MNFVDQITLRTLNSCRVFLDRNADQFADLNRNINRQKLDRAVASVHTHVATLADLTARARLAALRRHELRAEARNAIRIVVAISRTTLRHIPELASLKLPAEGASQGIFVATLNHVADVVTRYRTLFATEGLSQDVAEEFRSYARQLNLSGAGQRITAARSRMARRDLVAALRSGRQAYAFLDALILLATTHAPALAAQWRAMR